MGCDPKQMDSPTGYKTVHRTLLYTGLRPVPPFRIPTQIKSKGTANAVPLLLVGVSGFEPEASWTRTKRDTKLRHTPIAILL